MDLSFTVNAPANYPKQLIPRPELIDEVTMCVALSRLETIHNLRRMECLVYVKAAIALGALALFLYLVRKCRTRRRLTPMEKQTADAVERTRVEQMIRHMQARRRMGMGRPYETARANGAGVVGAARPYQGS